MWTIADLHIKLPELTGLSDAAATVHLNHEMTSALVDVKAADIIGVLIRTGEWGLLKVHGRRQSQDHGERWMIGEVVNFIDFLMLEDVVRLSSAEVAHRFTTMLDNLVQCQKLKDSSREALIALFKADVPVWDPAVLESDVRTARGR